MNNLFKAWSPVLKKWVYGDSIKTYIDERTDKFTMKIILSPWFYDDLSSVIVNPQTLGIFTEVLDIKGNQIYEGDKIQGRYKNKIIKGKVRYNKIKQNYCVITQNKGNFSFNSLKELQIIN